MLIAVFTEQQKEWLEYAIIRATTQHEQFGLAFDPIDNSLKWKVGQGPWSPPIPTHDPDSRPPESPGTMGTGNVNDDDEESLNFADEGEDDPCSGGRCPDPEMHAEGGHDI
jgi:hypothetical protein